jgi:hypothetical protein
MPGLLQRFLPREEDFFVLFSKQADNIQMGAKALLQMLEHYTGVPEQVQSIKAIEHDGDEITHSIFTKLNQSFVTPFDREHIHELTSQLDDVIDLIDAAASRFVLFAFRAFAQAPWTWCELSFRPPPRFPPPSGRCLLPRKLCGTASRLTATKTRATACAAP